MLIDNFIYSNLDSKEDTQIKLSDIIGKEMNMLDLDSIMIDNGYYSEEMLIFSSELIDILNSGSICYTSNSLESQCFIWFELVQSNEFYRHEYTRRFIIRDIAFY